MSLNSSKNNRYIIRHLILSSFFAALIFVATAYLPKIPTAFGYLHLGDGFILIAASLLPLPYAVASAAIGASLADLLSGYAIWIPATFIIKALIAICISSKTKRVICLRNCIGIIPAALINAAGYYVFQALFISHSFIVAFVDVPFNVIQTLVGGVIFILIGILFDKTPSLKRMVSSHYTSARDNTDASSKG